MPSHPDRVRRNYYEGLGQLESYEPADLVPLAHWSMCRCGREFHGIGENAHVAQAIGDAHAAICPVALREDPYA